MSKHCGGCGELKGNGDVTAAQRELEVGGICRKCNDVNIPGGGVKGSSKPTVQKSAKTSKNARLPGNLPPQPCASPACKKVGKGYKLCRGCMLAYYCSER